MSSAKRIFLSYADEDEALRINLQKHLSPLERSGQVAIWHRGKVLPGDDPALAIRAQLLTADVVVFLVSADLLASEMLHEEQLRPALSRRERDGTRVVPILVKPCVWTATAMANIEPLPQNRIPIVLWPHPDEAWAEVVKGLTAVLESSAFHLCLSPSPNSSTAPVDRESQSGHSSPPIVARTRLPRLAGLSQLEGIWLDLESSSTYCLRVVDDRIRACYCFMGDDHLVGEYYDLKLIEDRVYARFRWMDDRVRGYAQLRFEDIDQATGGWWFRDSVPQAIRADVSRLSDSLPGMLPARWVRRKFVRMPHWAEAFFLERQWTE